MKLNKDRRFPGEPSPRPDLAKFKREEASERLEQYEKLSASEKIAKLDQKFGIGKGAKKQREKLSRMVTKPIQEVAIVNESDETKPKRNKFKKEK